MTNGLIQPTAVLVHVSDLHFSCTDPGVEERKGLVRRRLQKDVAAVLEADLRRRADAVVVTGDIAYGGADAEYHMAADWLQELLRPIDNGSTPVLCVPGNHDVDWARLGPTHQAHRIALRSCSDEGLDSMLDGFLREDGQAILHPLAAYNEFAASRSCGIDSRFCWDVELGLAGGYAIDFRGVATVVNSGRDDAAETLAVHSNQLIYTRSPGRIPVLLAHHDPHYWRRYHRLEAEVRTRMALALYGHTHTPRLRKIEECVEVTAGAVHPEEGPDWQPGYNVIQLDVVDEASGQATIRVRIWRRRFSVEHDAFINDTRSGTYEERTVTIPAAAAQLVDAADPAARNEEAPVPLATPDGAPNPIREVQLALYDLGAGDRIALLAQIGIAGVDDLARLPPHRLLRRAAEEIIAQGKTDEFRTAIAGRAPTTGDHDGA